MKNVMKRGILSVVGSTPLVKMERIFKHLRFEFYAKLEQYNPGGSMKDRPALHIITEGLKSGAIKPETVIIESSSGNMGIGLAQVCLYHKLRFICVIDPRTTAQNIALLKAYGAEIEMVERPDLETGEYLPARLRRIKELLQVFENSFWSNQYANEQNAQAHYQTMQEISSGMDSSIDFLFCATSTCGTLKGCSEYIKANHLKTAVIAVDAVGSVIFDRQKGKRLIPGHGAAIVPDLYRPGLANACIHVNDLDCVRGCHRLLSEEALLCGGSSGAIVAAIEHFSKAIPEGAVCVAIFPDKGERYLDTIYSEEWVTKHFGAESVCMRIPPETALRTQVITR
jgi:cysteine synthase A